MTFNPPSFLPPLLATGTASSQNGRQQLGNGLVTHRGILDMNSLRATGQLYPQSGAGVELNYNQAAPKYGVLQSYDRDAAAYTDLYLSAKNINLVTQAGGKVSLPAGTAQSLVGQWYQPSGWSLPQINVWTESDVRVNCTCTGAPLRMEFGCNVNVPAGGVVYVGLALNGVAQWPSVCLLNFATACVASCSGVVYYVNPPPGVQRIGIMFYGGVLPVSLNAGSYASLWVTEQRA